MEQERLNRFKGRITEARCPCCNETQYEKYGIHYCITPMCDGRYIQLPIRKKAQETLKRIGDKYIEYTKSDHQIQPILNDPYYEGFLQAYGKFNAMALFVKKDLTDKRHGGSSLMVIHYLEFFEAAEQFEIMLDSWKINEEE